MRGVILHALCTPAYRDLRGSRASSLSIDRGSNMKYRMKYRTTRPARNVALALGASILLGSLSAYGSNASDLAKERVAQSDTSVEQAQQTLGKSEHGAVSLQQARDKLNAAKGAL